MKYRKEDGRYLVRLERGDNVHTCLVSLAREEAIGGASISGIGVFERCTLAFFDDDTQAYVEKEFRGGLEVLGLHGNLAWLSDGEPMVHLHAALGQCDYRMVGGHLSEGIVSATLEVVLTVTDPIRRGEPVGPLRFWKLT